MNNSKLQAIRTLVWRKSRAYQLCRVCGYSMEQHTENGLDPKTAKLIEEMEKSLHNMEKSLGPEHIVIAKILDSYARLLRNNGLRPVDAVNLEARAKAIRAKHNQEEAEKQSVSLGPIVHQKKKLRTSQAKMIVWLFCLLALAGLILIGMKTTRLSGKHVKDSQSNLEFKTTYENRDPQSGELISKTTVTEPGQVDSSKLTIFEIAGRLMQIKKLAKQQILVGRKQEKDNDLDAARETYRIVVDAEEDAAKTLGRQAHSIEIAECFERYAALIEQNDPDESVNCRNFAALCRRISN